MKDTADTDRLEELARPLVEYLKENCHPHSAIVITAERTAVIERVSKVLIFMAGMEAEHIIDEKSGTEKQHSLSSHRSAT